MNPTAVRARRIVLCSIFLSAAVASVVHAGGAPEQTLQGCWRGERTVLHYEDGTTSETGAHCVVRYGERRYLTVCADPSGRGADARMEGRYEQIGDGTYIATLTRHTRSPHLVGQRSTVHFHLAGDRLFTTVYPPRKPGMKQIVAVETSSVRMPDDRPSLRCPML